MAETTAHPDKKEICECWLATKEDGDANQALRQAAGGAYIDNRDDYPILVSAEEGGSYTIASPNFPAIRFSAPSLEYGLQSVPELLQDELAGLVCPPVPTPVNQIMLPEGAFLMQIAPA